MLDDVVDTQVDGELLLEERLGGVELARLIPAQSLDVVLPGADGRLGRELALAREVARAGRHVDLVELFLAVLERGDDVVLEEFRDFLALLRAGPAVACAAERGESRLLRGKDLIRVVDDGLRRLDVVGDVAVDERRDGVEVVAVVFDVGDLPVAVRGLREREYEGERGRRAARGPRRRRARAPA